MLAGQIGRGTFVRSVPAETRTPYIQDERDGGIVDLSILKPVCTDWHREMLGRALQTLGGDLPTTVISSFRPSVALAGYREPALAWLKLAGLDVRVEQLVITNGASSAMTVALMTATGPGNLVVTETLGHHTLKPLAGYLGFRLQGLEIDDEGIVPDAFERACIKSTVKALYIMPSGLNPTAVTTGAERRMRLAAIARRHDVSIIENDAWGPIQPGRPPPPLASFAPERCFYVTSFTKCLMPGLRLGYLTVPETFESAAARQKRCWTGKARRSPNATRSPRTASPAASRNQPCSRSDRLRLVGKAGAAVLHLGDPRIRIARTFLRQTLEHLAVAFTAVATHDRPQRRMGLHGRGIDADPVALDQPMLGQLLQNPGKRRLVDLKRQT